MTDPRNRYALETSGSVLSLSKYVNGARTLLDSRHVAFQRNVEYAFKIKAQGSRLQVYMDDVPYFDMTDSTFSAGKFGPFSNKSYVSFSSIAHVELTEPNVSWLSSYAIWEEGTAEAQVRYSNILFEDPEHDPRAGSNQWVVQHTPKFLNNQGMSALHGKTMSSPALIFDKVGNYRVTLRTEDDPNPSYLYPNMELSDYRKNSNEYWRMITVHRRPVAEYTLSMATDHSIIWNDMSYDPDRWLSSSNYSTEKTGVNYQSNQRNPKSINIIIEHQVV